MAVIFPRTVAAAGQGHLGEGVTGAKGESRAWCLVTAAWPATIPLVPVERAAGWGLSGLLRGELELPGGDVRPLRRVGGGWGPVLRGLRRCLAGLPVVW